MPGSTTQVPHGYVTPSWPSLYWPIRPAPDAPKYLYYTSDIWRFTLYWTLLSVGAVHVVAAGLAVLMQLRSAVARAHSRSRKAAAAAAAGGGGAGWSSSAGVQGSSVKQTLGWVWLVPVVYCVVGGIEAILAGSVEGLVLGTVYSAGYYRMSTWTPFIWGLINVLILILASFSMHGGL
jgi:hypothetical protein